MPVPYGSMLHIPPTNFLLLAGSFLLLYGSKQEPYKFLKKKANRLTKNIEEFSGKSIEEKTERVTGLGRRTREEIAK